MIGGPPIAAGSYITATAAADWHIKQLCAFPAGACAENRAHTCITERPSVRLTPRTWNDQVTELNRAVAMAVTSSR